MKIGKYEFAWTRNRIIAAAIAGLVIVGLVVGEETSTPKTPTVPMTPLPTGDVKLPDDVRANVDALTRGAMIFVFFHEAGHMIITELKLPAVGPEEDVADEFAAYILAEAMVQAPDEQKDALAHVLLAGALYWKLAAEKRGDNILWSDEHSPDMRRYYNILCIAAAADPLRFIPMAVKSDVSENRLHRCARDYKTKHAAWNNLLEQHQKSWIVKALNLGGRLTLQTEVPNKTDWIAYQQAYEYNGAFQTMLDGISDVTYFENDVPVIAKGCAVANAWWSPRDRRITLCYNMFEELQNTFTALAVAQMQAQQQQQGGGQQPAPAGAAGGSLVGRWSCQGMTPSGATQEDVTYQADGQFSSNLVFVQTGLRMTGWGRWTMMGADTVRIDLAGTNPPGGGGSTVVNFQMPQPNIIQTASGSCQKTG